MKMGSQNQDKAVTGSIESCTCEVCVNMCKHRPCWGTPDDIEKIIAAGYGNKLMLDWFAVGEDDVMIVAPAIIGYENKKAPAFPSGTCAFLKNDLCVLHDQGLKPREGKKAYHDPKTKSGDIHKHTAKTWETLKGTEVVESCKNSITEDE